MSPPSLSKLKVLIVDDEQFSRAIIARILRKLDISEIRVAANGYEGLGRLRYPSNIDLVILDHNMPGMNGLEMLKRIRDGSGGVDRDVAVAMLTGHGDGELVAIARALDVNAFMVKPASVEVVAARLNAILDEPREVREAAYYGGIEVPTVIRLSSDISRRIDQTLVHEELIHGGPVRLDLKRVPPGARLAEEVYGPDGMLLMPAGITLTERLLAVLANLLTFDDCVAHLAVHMPARA